MIETECWKNTERERESERLRDRESKAEMDIQTTQKWYSFVKVHTCKQSENQKQKLKAELVIVLPASHSSCAPDMHFEMRQCRLLLLLVLVEQLC